ncbi:MAG: tetratricopeptide repeat protein [Planctomycetes bacterium]|nr:tetratricopeptide repeat protein [Planctomycetota bacterium]
MNSQLVGFALVWVAIAGCQSGRESRHAPSATGEVTFSEHVAPLVFANCSYCHRPGEAAPFSLLSYDDVRRRARQIARVTRSRFMPPWRPEQGGVELAGDRRLSDEQIRIFEEWAAAGAPPGDLSDAPEVPRFAEGWQLGTPDLALESPAFQLAAAGSDRFRTFVIPIALDAPRWICTVELRPENPRVTHHARLGIDRSHESARRDAADAEPGYDGVTWGQDPNGQIITWAPGMIARHATPGTAWRLHPQTDLVLLAHLQPSGKPETVRFRIGLHFAAEPPAARPLILRIGSRDIDIPAGDANHVVTDEFVVPVDVAAHSIFPHAHSLCRTVSVDAELPGGARLPLLRIEDFDEKWHDNYRFTSPVHLPRGTKLLTRHSYDNSERNLRNRHKPPRRVVIGSNSGDEMADVYLQVTAVRPDQYAALLEDFERYERESKLLGLRKTIEVYRDDPLLYEELAICCLSMGEWKSAIEALETRLTLRAPEVHTESLLGMAYLAGGDRVRAEESLRRALEMDATYPLAWLGLGKTLGAGNDAAGAEHAYRRALEFAPALTDSHVNLAGILLARGQAEEAASLCEAALQLSPEMPNILLKLAEIRTKQGGFDESLRVLEAAHALAPYTHPPKALLAIFCIRNGEAELARKYLLDARLETPDHPVPALLLGQIALAERRVEEARANLDAAASAGQPDTWPASHRRRFCVQLYSERFKLAQAIGDTSLARESLQEWIRWDPDNAELRKQVEQHKDEETPVP